MCPSGGTYNGSAARTFAVDATDANTASKVVARDASGNFSAGTITATLSGAATSATTATNLAGGAANRIAYQTSAGISNFITAPTASNQVLNWNGSAFTWSAGTISGIPLGSNLNALTFGTFLTGTSYNGSGAVTIATNATNANTGSTLVARDASGNFSAGTITATLSGNATTSSSTSGNAATATALQTARNIGGVSFNGTANIDLPGVNTAGNQNTSGNAATATNASNLTGGTISGNYVVNNATSPNSFYLQFGDNTGWTYRFMTSVSGTPTTRFSFVDNGDFTAVGSVTSSAIITRENVQVIGGNTTAVRSRMYVFTASLTLTLPSSPTAGDVVMYSNRSGTSTPVIARNGQNIMGLAEDMTVDNVNYFATLVFADATRGWVFQ